MITRNSFLLLWQSELQLSRLSVLGRKWWTNPFVLFPLFYVPHTEIRLGIVALNGIDIGMTMARLQAFPSTPACWSRPWWRFDNLLCPEGFQSSSAMEAPWFLFAAEAVSTHIVYWWLWLFSFLVIVSFSQFSLFIFVGVHWLADLQLYQFNVIYCLICLIYKKSIIFFSFLLSLYCFPSIHLDLVCLTFSLPCPPRSSLFLFPLVFSLHI